MLISRHEISAVILFGVMGFGTMASAAGLEPRLTELGAVKAYEWVIPPSNELCGATSAWISGAGGGPADTKTYICDKTFNSRPTDVLADPSKAVLEYGSIEPVGNTTIGGAPYYVTCTYSRRIDARMFSWTITLKARARNAIPVEHLQAVRNWLQTPAFFDACKRLAPWATTETRIVVNRVVP